MPRLPAAQSRPAQPLLFWTAPDGRELLLTSGWDGYAELRFQDVDSGRVAWGFEEPELVLPLQDAAIAELPDGGAVLGVADPEGIHRWDALTGTSLGRVNETTVWSLTSSVSETGRTVFAGAGIDGHVHRWDAATGEVIGCGPLPAGTDSPPLTVDVLTVRGETRVVVAYDDRVIRQWNAATGDCQAGTLSGSWAAVSARAGGEVLIAGGHYGGTLTLTHLT